MTEWRQQAKCLGKDYTKWHIGHSSTRTAESAMKLCEGCPVIDACYEDALKPMVTVDGFPVETEGVIRGGRIFPHKTYYEQRDYAYRRLIEEGYSFSEIADILGIAYDTLMRWISRRDLPPFDRQLQKMRDMVETWIARRERWTEFDFPFDIPRGYTTIIQNWAKREHGVISFGEKSIFERQFIVWGAPDSLDRRGTLDSIDDYRVFVA